MTEDDRWRWHAYHCGWRRVFTEVRRLRTDDGKLRETSPIDEPGDWFNPGMASRTEEFFRAKHRRPAKWQPKQATGRDAVRAEWRRIPATELTDAEHKLADPEIGRLAAKATRLIAEIVSRSKRAFRDKNTHFEARDGIERPITSSTVDVSPEELMARVGGYAIKKDGA